MKFFGLSITRDTDEEPLKSFVAPENEDGAIEIAAAGGTYGTYLDLSGQARSEADLVTKYRVMERDPVVKKAIEDIVNEAVVLSDEERMVSIVLNDAVKIPNSVKRKIEDEFNECLNLLNYRVKAYDIFQRWYVDGRLKFHAVINEKKPQEGIKELRYIDPRKIRKVREVKPAKLAPGVEGV